MDYIARYIELISRQGFVPNEQSLSDNLLDWGYEIAGGHLSSTIAKVDFYGTLLLFHNREIRIYLFLPFHKNSRSLMAWRVFMLRLLETNSRVPANKSIV